MSRSKSARRAKARAAAALEGRAEWGDAPLLLDDDDQLKRAAEAFLAGARERERAVGVPATTAQGPGPEPEASRGAIGEVSADEEPIPSGVAPGVARQVGDRRERSRRADPGTPVAILDGPAWDDVVRHEAARWQRHGGSVAVLAVRLARRRRTATAWNQPDHEPAAVSPVGAGDPLAAERFAIPLGDVLRHRARASDPVARVAPDQFSVLLLEADEDGASAYAERIRAICEPWVTAVPGDLALRIGWAVPQAGGSLELAAEDAYARVQATSS